MKKLRILLILAWLVYFAGNLFAILSGNPYRATVVKRLPRWHSDDGSSNITAVVRFENGGEEWVDLKEKTYGNLLAGDSVRLFYWHRPGALGSFANYLGVAGCLLLLYRETRQPKNKMRVVA